MVQDLSVFPAYAGMIPENRPCRNVACSVPRIRGDDPLGALPLPITPPCSPHTRG